MDSLTGLWSIAALTFVLYVVATVRHRYAVAHGIEEQELDQEEAARVDQERLTKLGEKLKR
jgi:hypothetical protein